MKKSRWHGQAREIFSITYHTHMLFQCGSFVLKSSAHKAVARIARLMKRFPHLAIDIEHGADDYNTEIKRVILHRKRLEKIEKAFFIQGIDRMRVRTCIGTSMNSTTQTLGPEHTFHFRLFYGAMIPPSYTDTPSITYNYLTCSP